MGLELVDTEEFPPLGIIKSPSHTVGLKPLQTCNCSLAFGTQRVSIPHGGLETFEQVKLYAKPELSPSHTVGLEHYPVYVKVRFHDSLHPTQWA